MITTFMHPSATCVSTIMRWVKNAKKRNKVHHFWDNSATFSGTGQPAMKQLLGIVHMIPEDPLDSWDDAEEDIYGIGGVQRRKSFTTLAFTFTKRLSKIICVALSTKTGPCTSCLL